MPVLKETTLARCIANSPLDVVIKECQLYCERGKEINVKDENDHRSYLHVLAENAEKFTCPRGTSIVYLFAIYGIHLNQQDKDGNTFLHDLVRKSGVYRVLIAAIRSGADVTTQNKSGQTVEDVLLEAKPEEWEETHYWLHQYMPGLGVLPGVELDQSHIERLLSMWCLPSSQSLDVYQCSQTLLDRYKKTNEFVHATLTGHFPTVQKWIQTNDIADVNLDTHDHGFHVHYRASPVEPRPLLLAVWELGCHETVRILLENGVNTGTLFSFDSKKELPKPAFFHVFTPDCRPVEPILHSILRFSDINLRNTKGQTILYEAILNEEPDNLIRFLLEKGTNVAFRDTGGRTARDYAVKVGKQSYCEIIDQHLLDFVRNQRCDIIEDYFLRGYDHVTDIVDINGQNAFSLARQLKTTFMLELLKRESKYKDLLHEIFQAADSGSQSALKQLLGSKTVGSRDACGRTVLHRAILAEKYDMIRDIVKEHPCLLDNQDSLRRTPLHYAYLIIEDNNFINHLLQAGASNSLIDVYGNAPSEYRPSTLGQREFVRYQLELRNLSLEVFMVQRNFQENFYRAVKAGDRETMSDMMTELGVYGNINRFGCVLFDCVDRGEEEVALHLISAGMDTDIYKEYYLTNADGKVVGTSMLSLLERAKLKKCERIVQAIVNTSNPEATDEMSERCDKPADEMRLYGLI